MLLILIYAAIVGIYGTFALELKESCLVLISETEYKGGRSESKLECELQGVDLHGSYHKTVEIDGLSMKWAEENGVESGVTELYAKKAVIDSTDQKLQIAENGKIELGSVAGNFRGRNLQGTGLRKPTNGVYRVLVIRAEASDSSTTVNETVLSNKIFGTQGDVLNLKSQFAQCSDGKLQFEPLISNSLVGDDGVYTVSLPNITVNGTKDSIIREAMTNQAAIDFNATLDTIADFVMLCVPPGTSGEWYGYAFVNSWLSVFNNNQCVYPSLVVHEIGHNLNMAHSTEGDAEYGDASCLMAGSYIDDEGPRMCFNAPKTYQLGWYSEYYLDINANDVNTQGAISLVGLAEKANAVASDKMIVRIITSNVAYNDTYIHFNRKIGINSGVIEGGDQILIYNRKSGTDYQKSDLLSKLSASGTYTVSGFNGPHTYLVVTVGSINLATVPAKATISMQSGVIDPSPAPTSMPTNFPTAAPTASPTAAPTTAAPTKEPTTAAPTKEPTTGAPTKQPTSIPTNVPTQQPTAFPTAAPTPNPTRMPTTSAPTLDPTRMPTPAPTLPPTRMPTPAPTSPPTRMPTFSPTDVPTSFPTSSPTAVPTSFPTSSPTDVPTSSPTSSPTDVPTSSPTLPPTDVPTSAPTSSPTHVPTSAPTSAPTGAPTTANPTTKPPTKVPTTKPPTRSPTKFPTKPPSKSPTRLPTKPPTKPPTKIPTTAGRQNPQGNTVEFSWWFL